MRIAYVINSVEGGGAALPVPAVATVLRDEGATVAVFALTRRDGRAIAAMAAAGLAVHVRPGGTGDHAAALRWLDGQVARFRPTHIWTSLTRATLLGQLVGLRRRVPVVSWQHAAFLKPANLALLRATRRLSRLWVGDSEAITRITAERLRVPAAALATWPIFRADPAAPQAAPWAGGPVALGSLGRLHPVKGYGWLAEALERLDRPVRARIGGDGDERAVLAAHPALDLAGYVADPPAFLAGLHLYVQPSRSEGFCIAAHEAMAAGLPVIGSATGEMRHSILPGETGWLVPPGDVAALAAALGEALAAPDRLAAMGQAARARVLARYGPDRFARAGAAIVARLRTMA